MNNFEWAQANHLDQALSAAGDGIVFKAGGVDLLDLLKERLIAPKRVVNLRLLNELDFLFTDKETESVHIGPMMTLAAVASHDVVNQKYLILSQAVGAAATPQIRNMATIGGNLLQRPRCWYFRNDQFPCRRKGGDICFAQDGENQYHAIFDNKQCAIVHPSAAATPLVALGATLVLKKSDGQREVPASKFFVLPNVDIHHENVIQPNEILTEIRIPKLASGTTQAYSRLTEKQSFDWPIAEVAVVLERDGNTVRRVSIVMGAASPAPHRAKEAEAVLVGKPIDEKIADQAAKAAIKNATPLERNQYKLAVFQTAIRRTILEAAKA